jgi:hypothetical protein
MAPCPVPLAFSAPYPQRIPMRNILASFRQQPSARPKTLPHTISNPFDSHFFIATSGLTVSRVTRKYLLFVQRCRTK